MNETDGVNDFCGEDKSIPDKSLSVEGVQKRKKRPPVSEKRIVKEFVDIAFSEDTKTADRLRALDWLSDNLSNRKKDEEIMNKLDEVLSKIDFGF